MSKTPLLTVITPTYNRSNYLIEAIESVLAQTLFDFDYIIIDDGSTDRTADVVNRYFSATKPVGNVNVMLLQQSNMGETRTVNKALRMVRSEFFTVVNSDDTILPHCFEKVIEALRRSPDALAAYPDWHVIDAESRILNTIRQIRFDIVSMLTQASIPIGPGACFRTSALELIGYRNPLLRYSADLDYWYRLALAGPIVHVPEPLATHRVHGESASISDKGSRLADETAYLFRAYCRHPLLGQKSKRLRALAAANGCFAAMFVSTSARQAARLLTEGILAHPVGMLTQCRDHGIDAAIKLFESFGTSPKESTERRFADVLAARSRTEAVLPMMRGTLADPLGMLVLAKQHGIDNLIGLVRALPAGRTQPPTPRRRK